MGIIKNIIMKQEQIPLLTRQICKRFKMVRLEANLTQPQYGAKLNLTRSAVNAIEHFRYCPSIETIKLIKKKFNKSYDWIIEGK